MSKQLIPKPVVFMIGILFIGGIIILDPKIDYDVSKLSIPEIQITNDTFTPPLQNKPMSEDILPLEEPQPEPPQPEPPNQRPPVQIPPEPTPVNDRDDPPFFKSFGEEITWYSEFPNDPEYKVEIDTTEGEPTCDDIIRFYKSNTQFEYRVILSKMVIEVCDFG